MSLSSYCLLDSPTSLPIDKGFSTFFWHLYKNHLYTDVKFHLETADGVKEYYAHKLVLSLMSPIFAERFYNKDKARNQQEKVLVENLDADAFGEMLRFMYGHIPQIESPKQACNLYQVAAKFEVSSLKKKCDQFLHQIEVEPSNVFTVLEVAEFMQNKSLTDRCFALIQGKTHECLCSCIANALSDITTSVFHIILDLPTLSLTSEYELLKWVFSWAKEKASQVDSHYSNVREVLQEFLPDMHFLLLSNVEFTEICRDYDGFFTSDEIASILMNISIPGSKQMPDWYNKDRILRAYPKKNVVIKSNSEQITVTESEQNENEETESKQNESEENKSEETKDVKDKAKKEEGDETAAEKSSSIPILPPLKKHDLTYEELKKYDGKGEDGRICVAINGKVFDVTKRKQLYGPDGPSPSLAGRDASRCFATLSLEVVKDEYEDISDLTSTQIESLKEWEIQFQERYPYVGRLLKPGEEPADYSNEEEVSHS